MSRPKLLLASRSLRRAQLLRDAGYDFEVVETAFDDPAQPVAALDQSPPQHASQLALRKVQSIVEPGSGRWAALAADTIVIAADNDWLGQPATRQQAECMLERIINQTHRVVTAVALRSANDDRAEVFFDVVEVTLGAVDNLTRTQYLDSGAWRGKAGGYNLFELQNDWPFVVKGDPTTVVGLPMMKLVHHLSVRGVEPTIDVHSREQSR